MTSRPPPAIQRRMASSCSGDSWLLSMSCQTSRSSALQPSARVGQVGDRERARARAARRIGFAGRLICETSACGRSAMTPTTSCVASWTRYATSTLSMTWSFDDELDLDVPPERRRLRVEDVHLVRAGRKVDRHREPGIALRRRRPSAARPGSTGPSFWRSTSIAAHEPVRAWPWRRIRAFIVTSPACCARAGERRERAERERDEAERTRETQPDPPFASRNLLVSPVPDWIGGRAGAMRRRRTQRRRRCPDSCASAPDSVDFVAGLLPGAAPIVRFPPVPSIRPFRALRYSPELVPDLSTVVAPPYDVISAGGASAPAGAGPTQRRPAGPARGPGRAIRRTSAIAAPRTSCRRGVRTGRFGATRDPRSIPTSRRTASRAPIGRATRRGVFARVVLEPFGPDVGRSRARAHARGAARGPLPAPPGDRRQHEPGRRPRRGCDRVRAGMAGARSRRRAPVAELADDDGVGHRLWLAARRRGRGARRGHPVGSARRLGASPITLADGHHRYETALRYARGAAPRTGARGRARVGGDPDADPRAGRGRADRPARRTASCSGWTRGAGRGPGAAAGAVRRHAGRPRGPARGLRGGRRGDRGRGPVRPVGRRAWRAPAGAARCPSSRSCPRAAPPCGAWT